MKTDKNFRMSKPAKTRLALKFGQRKGAPSWKALFIEADVCEKTLERVILDKKANGGEE